MEIPDAVAAGEHVGRSVFSTKHARRAARSRAPLNIFLERPDREEQKRHAQELADAARWRSADEEHR